MKKVLFVIGTFIFMQIVIFMSSFGYVAFDGNFDFKEITATEQKEIELQLHDYNLYTSTEIINILNNCQFESLGLIDALHVINSSNDSITICTNLIFGEADLFQNNQYLSGRILLFNPNEVYYYVTYKDIDSKILEIDFSRTVYKVSIPADLYDQLISNEMDVNETSLKKEILNVMWYEYTLIQKNSYMIIINILVLIIVISMILISLKKYLRILKSNKNNSVTENN